MMRSVSVAVSVVFLTLAGIHIYWAGGGRWGAHATTPQTAEGRPLIHPGRGGTLAVAAALTVAGLIPLGLVTRIGQSLAPEWLYRSALWLVAAMFLVRTIGDGRYVGLFKKAQGGLFAKWDTLLYTPLCFVLALGCIVLALGHSRPRR